MVSDTAPGVLGWAVVGCGWVARDYVIPAIEASRNARLVALCDPDPGALASAAAGSQAGAPDMRRTASLAEALTFPEVQAVYIATPNDLHEVQAVAAADAGKHVLCEKPMATTGSAARRIQEACARAGVRYGTAFDQRFHSAHRELARLVGNGALGTVTQARIHYACWLPPDWAPDNWRVERARAGGGAVVDLAPHGLDLVHHLVGSPVIELRAFLQRVVHDYPVDDGGVLIARHADCTLTTLNVAYNCPETFPRRRLELVGTRAMAIAIDTMGQTPGGRLQLVDAASGEASDVAFDRRQSPFVAQLEEFGDAVREGVPFAGTTPAHDVRLVELLERALNDAEPIDA